MTLNLAFFGPPGSGKGTQAKLLAEKFNLPHISLGDILREEVRQGTEMGKKIKVLIDAGKLAPNEMTIALTEKRLAQPDCRQGFILDGYPRSEPQAEALDKIMADLKKKLDKVVYFQVNEDMVVERLSGRRSCKQCGAVYHVKFNRSRAEGKCDNDGSELYQRKDDVESAIRTRFEVYAKETEPLLERYRRDGSLATVDASGSIDEVFKRLLAAIGHGGN
jgi:adenylate kinase